MPPCVEGLGIFEIAMKVQQKHSGCCPTEEARCDLTSWNEKKRKKKGKNSDTKISNWLSGKNKEIKI